MKFFLPQVQKDDKAEELYQGVKAFNKDRMNWEISNRRIFRIEYSDKGKIRKDEVGKVTDVNGEKVLAILESNAYLVCTLNRGFSRGLPIQVGKHEIIGIEDFEK